jgi:hypothetical protein
MQAAELVLDLDVLPRAVSLKPCSALVIQPATFTPPQQRPGE